MRAGSYAPQRRLERANQRERRNERMKHRMRKLEDEFLRATKRGWFRTCEISYPVHEVEAHVALLNTVRFRRQHSLERAEERTRRCLRLNKPTVIVSELGLREPHCLVHGFPKRAEGWKALAVVFENVSQRDVMVVDLVALGETFVWCVLWLNSREEHVNLHDIMNSSECQQSDNALDNNFKPVRLLHEKPCIAQHRVQFVPLRVHVEG